MADNTSSGSFGDNQDKNAQDSLPNLDFGPPVTDTSNTTQSAQDQLPNLDFGPPVTPQDQPTGTDSTSIDITDTGAPVADEPFVGSGGVGSAEYMDALRRGHEQAGDEYASDFGKSDDTQGGTSA